MKTIFSFCKRSPSSEVLKAIKLVVFDFDGVMTDDRVIVNQDGVEAVSCHRGDGLGLGLLQNAGMRLLVISKETNPVVSARCKKLKIENIQSCDEKEPVLRAFAKNANIPLSEIAYVGNDLNDIPPMKIVGLPVAVANAVPVVKKVAKWITKKSGGHGAVREICDGFMKVR